MRPLSGAGLRRHAAGPAPGGGAGWVVGGLTADDALARVVASLYRHPEGKDRWFVSRIDDAVH